MASLTELLKGFNGTTAEEAEAYIKSNAEVKGIKIFLDDGEKNIYIPKARLDSEIAKNVQLKSTVAEQTQALKDLKGQIGDNEKAQETINKLTQQLDSMKEQMKEATLFAALKEQAAELGAMDETGKDLLAFIDKSKLIINEDGSVTGLKESLKSLKAQKQYLFKAEEPKPQDPAAGGQDPNPNPYPNSNGFFGTGAPGRPPVGGLGTHSKPGEFGKFLSQQNHNNQNQDYDFFK